MLFYFSAFGTQTEFAVGAGTQTEFAVGAGTQTEMQEQPEGVYTCC